MKYYISQKHKPNMQLISRFFLICFLAFIPHTSLEAQVDVDKLDAYLSKAQKDWKIPGMSIGIIKDGEVVLSKGYGMLEAGKTDPANGGSIYAIASNTKAFISTAIGILVDEGKLNWDDPVRKHLPYFALYDSYASEHTTVRDLLCHRVGLGTFSGDAIWYKSNYSAEEVIKRIKYVPQAYEYRAGYGYTNLMFITAGEVIKAASGKSWDEFIKERIFQPLGMDRTRTTVTDLELMANVAQPHKPNGWISQPIPYAKWDNMGAAGGILSSTDDMLKWIQLQLDHGTHENKQIFSEEAQGQFWKPHNNYFVSKFANDNFRNRNVSGYALGWGYFDYAGRMVYRHGGGYDGMYSQVAVIPEENLGIVVLTNTMRGIASPVVYYILDRFMNQEEKDWSNTNLAYEKNAIANWNKRRQERLDKRKTGTSPGFDLEAYAGTYNDPMYGDVILRVEEDRLLLEFPHAPALNARLEHWHDDTFEIKWREVHAWFGFGTIKFVQNNNRDITGIEFDVPNDDIFFDEIHAKRVK
ncbi:MAG: serine hydrolase [Bacteroidia bacterium]|nr:serine hydrolase [Bacteroidia bacterium]